ncbi:aam [Acrasis kona]|uniref:Aam n=1 Tax=Acrasis kona TaxID=1008807 RepID=A0AAW2YLV1_9EUKA
MPSKRLCFLSGTELLQGYKSGDISPVDVVKDVLLRIEEVNHTFNALNYIYDREDVLRQAKESELRWKEGRQSGILDGVPVTVKDLFSQKDIPTYFGSKLDPLLKPDYVSPNVSRLLEQKAIIVGKTTTPDHGWCGVTISPLTGITRNPYDQTKTSGGSSGGSGAAVPLGLGPISIGSDAGGSVRIPSAFCNLSTIKPTFGRIAHAPPSAFGTMSHVGPMTRTIEDVALCMDVIAVPDNADWYSLYPESNKPHVDYSSTLNNGVKNLNIAVSLDLGGYVDYVHPEVTQAVKQAAQVFKDLGANVTFIHGDEFPLAKFDIYKAFKTVWYSGAAHLLHRKISAKGQTKEEIMSLLDPGLVSIANKGSKLTTVDAMAAEFLRAQMGALMNDFHSKYHVLVTPTLPIPAFEAEREVPHDIEEVCTGKKSSFWEEDDLKRWWTWTPFTYPFNLTKQPAASVPCGEFSNGGSIGLQVVGGSYQDHLVLQVCQAYQKKTNFHNKQAMN